MTDPAASAIDFDLFCLTCGYNLRGLIGDPVLCPECGAMNGVAEPIVPSAMIIAETSMMEGVPRYALLFALVLISLGTLAALVPEIFPCAGTILILLPLLFGLVALMFRDDCRAQPGWFSCLLAYWCSSAVLVSAPIAVVCCAAHWSDTHQYELKLLSAMCATTLPIWIGHRLLYEPVLNKMRLLLRETAIERARERLRRRARSPRERHDTLSI